MNTTCRIHAQNGSAGGSFQATFYVIPRWRMICRNGHQWFAGMSAPCPICPGAPVRYGPRCGRSAFWQIRLGKSCRGVEHCAPALTCKEPEQFPARQLATEPRAAALICAMRMENTLGNIQTDRGNFRHGRLPQVVLQHLHFGTSMPSGGVHPISFRGQAARQLSVF